jgi:hypothetical protein
MKPLCVSIILCGVLLPLGNLGWAGSGASAATRYQYRQPTEAQRLAKQHGDERTAQQQSAAQSSAAGAPGPQGTIGPGSGQGKTTGGTHR